MTQDFFELDQKKALYDDFHTTVMEHGLWLCRSIADRFNEVSKEIIVDFKLPCDIFRLQRMYLLFYDRIIEQYKEVFAIRLYSRLERNVVRSEDELVSLVKTKLFDEDAERTFAMNLTTIFNQYITSYLSHYFNTVCDQECVTERLVSFKQFVKEEAGLFIKITLRFISDNSTMFLSYLNDLYEKRIEIDDLFGRCIFMVIEDKYDIQVFFDGQKEVRYFYREFCSSVLKALKMSVFGEKKYDSLNASLKKYVRNLLSEDMPITKYSFPIFFYDKGYQAVLAEALHFILRKTADPATANNFRNRVVELLKEEGHSITFTPQHFYILLDAWTEFINESNPGLLEMEQAS